jgi:AcrR family transcriptional regulator
MRAPARTTFYAHFPNKASLLEGALADLREILCREEPAPRGRPTGALP